MKVKKLNLFELHAINEYVEWQEEINKGVGIYIKGN